MTGNVDRAIWPDLVARAIRNAALATPGLERAFVLGLVGWLHVELLFRFRESEALNLGITRTAVFACRSCAHGRWRRTSGRRVTTARSPAQTPANCQKSQNTVTFPRSSEHETPRSRQRMTQVPWPACSGIRRRTSATILRGMPLVQVLGSQDSPASRVRNPLAARNGTNVLNLSGRGQCPERA